MHCFSSKYNKSEYKCSPYTYLWLYDSVLAGAQLVTESFSALISFTLFFFFFLTVVYSFFSISKLSVTVHQLYVKENQVHSIYYPCARSGHVNIWLHKYRSRRLSCCLLSTMVSFSSSDYMIHKWVIIPGREGRSQWQHFSVYFRWACSVWALPVIACPILTSRSSGTKQGQTGTKVVKWL